MTDWRSLVCRRSESCGSCDLAGCVGLAPDARDERPLPVLACEHRAGPFYPYELRCPHFLRPAEFSRPKYARRREGDMGECGDVVDRKKPKKGNTR